MGKIPDWRTPPAPPPRDRSNDGILLAILYCIAIAVVIAVFGGK